MCFAYKKWFPCYPTSTEKISAVHHAYEGRLDRWVSNIGYGKSIFKMRIPMFTWLLRASVTLNSEEQHLSEKVHPA
jgi:hypothetical protein